MVNHLDIFAICEMARYHHTSNTRDGEEPEVSWWARTGYESECGMPCGEVLERQDLRITGPRIFSGCTCSVKPRMPSMPEYKYIDQVC